LPGTTIAIPRGGTPSWDSDPFQRSLRFGTDITALQGLSASMWSSALIPFHTPDLPDPVTGAPAPIPLPLNWSTLPIPPLSLALYLFEPGNLSYMISYGNNFGVDPFSLLMYYDVYGSAWGADGTRLVDVGKTISGTLRMTTLVWRTNGKGVNRGRKTAFSH